VWPLRTGRGAVASVRFVAAARPRSWLVQGRRQVQQASVTKLWKGVIAASIARCAGHVAAGKRSISVPGRSAGDIAGEVEEATIRSAWFQASPASATARRPAAR